MGAVEYNILVIVRGCSRTLHLDGHADICRSQVSRGALQPSGEWRIGRCSQHLVGEQTRCDGCLPKSLDETGRNAGLDSCRAETLYP